MQGLKLIFSAGTVFLVIGTVDVTAGLPKTPHDVTTPDTVHAAAEDGVNNATGGSSGTGPLLSAAEPKNDPVAVAKDNSVSDNQTQTVQDRLAAIVEDDYLYEKARRKLANEVELEKMRSELRKLRGEDRKVPQLAEPSPSKVEPQQQSAQAVILPRVMLEAQIGGVQRTAVTDGDTVRYVRAGEIFSMGGNSYQLAKDKKTVLPIESATQ